MVELDENEDIGYILTLEEIEKLGKIIKNKKGE